MQGQARSTQDDLIETRGKELRTWSDRSPSNRQRYRQEKAPETEERKKESTGGCDGSVDTKKRMESWRLDEWLFARSRLKRKATMIEGRKKDAGGGNETVLLRSD